MYRNITYQINEDRQGVINLYTWDSVGNPITKQCDHQVHVSVKSEKTTKYKSIFGGFAYRKYFKNIWDRKKFIEQYSGPESDILEAQRPEIEFLTSNFIDSNESTDFAQFPLRLNFLDIEIAVQDSFPDPTEARFPINLITCYDTYYKKYIVFAFGELKREFPLYELHRFETEKELLLGFLKWFERNYPDIISGWNSLRFDIPYIFNRVTKILGTSAAARLSPEGRIRLIKKFYKNQPYDHIMISGISHLDYLVLYRDKFQHRCPEGFKLDAVGKYELKMGKQDKLNGIPFKDQWKYHFDDFLEYNVQDVNILVELDSKLKLIDLTRKICNICLTPYETIYSSIPYLSNALSLFAKRKYNKIFPTYTLSGNIKKSYEGAFVLEPEKGFYEGGIITVDFNSLYPNTIIALNLSPETKIGRVVNVNTKTRQVELECSGIPQFIDMDKFAKEIMPKTTISVNKILFFKPEIKQGIIPLFLKHYYSERVKLKKIIGKLEKEYSNLLDLGKNESESSKAIKDEIKRRKTTDTAYKGFLNSIYGIFGTEFSPIYDIDCAESITLTGQLIIKNSIKFIDEWFKNKYGMAKSVIMGDTDSVAGDTKINIGGGVFTIEQVFSKFYDHYEMNRGKSLFFAPLIDLNGFDIDGFRFLTNNVVTTQTFDPLTSTLTNGHISKIIRHKVDKPMYKITTESRKEVVVTEDHSCVVIRDGKQIIISPKEMNIETDRLICIKKLSLKKKQ